MVISTNRMADNSAPEIETIGTTTAEFQAYTQFVADHIYHNAETDELWYSTATTDGTFAGTTFIPVNSVGLGTVGQDAGEPIEARTYESTSDLVRFTVTPALDGVQDVTTRTLAAGSYLGFFPAVPYTVAALPITATDINAIEVTGAVSDVPGVEVVLLANLPAEVWTPIVATTVTNAASYDVFRQDNNISIKSDILGRIVGGVVELRSSIPLTNLRIELEP